MARDQELSTIDSSLLEQANRVGDRLIERLESEFGAKAVRGDGYVEVLGYGLLVEKIVTSEQRFDKSTGSTDTRYSQNVEVKRVESRTLAWVRIEPALKEMLLAERVSEDKAADEQVERRRVAQVEHQKLVSEASAMLTPEQLTALRNEFGRR